MKKNMTLAAVIGLFMTATPTHAQIYFSEPNLSGTPVTGTEPELALNLPGATPAELKAGLTWHLRVAMNIAALQCDFAPSLLTVSNYNAALAHHKAELASAFSTLGGYFQRTNGTGKAGQRALDQYNTKIYSFYSTVHAQREFCNVMGKVGREAIFADRGSLYSLAQNHAREIRKSLAPAGEQYFTNPAYNFKATLPLFSKSCWKKDKLRSNCEASWRNYAAKQSQ